MSNPLMQNNLNPGAWLGGQSQPSQQAPVVSQDLKKLYTMYQASSDPKSFVRQVMSTNPTLEAMSHKGSMKDQFYAECQRRGVDPEAFLAQVEQGLKTK
mgnify:FL=1